LAQDLKMQVPEGTILNQYCNPNNPASHHITGREILRDCDNKVDAVVAGAGTGGTISGISQIFRKLGMNTLMVGIDPVGSIFADPKRLKPKPYAVEGIGYDFIPDVLNRDLVDQWISVNDKESFCMARRLIQEEGLLVGGSSGSAVAGALKAIKNFPELNQKGKRIVIILPDSIRNYLFKFVSDDWMISKGFMEPIKCPKIAFSNSYLSGPLKVLKRRDIMKTVSPCFPILVDSENNDEKILGLVSAVDYLKSKITGKDPCVEKNFVIMENPLAHDSILSYASTGYPIIVKDNNQYFKFDLENFLASNANIF
jgi:hypothetical protein